MATSALRPRSTGEILDAAIKLYQRHWRVLALCALPCAVPFVVVGLLVNSSLPSGGTSLLTPGDNGRLGTMLLLEGIASVIVFVTSAACYTAVGDAWLGVEPSARRALGEVLRRLPSVLGLWVIVVAGVFVGFTLFIAPGIWIAVCWWLAAPALMLERVGVLPALDRSFGLVRGHWWGTLWVLLAAVVLMLVVLFLVFGLLTGLASLAPGSGGTADDVAGAVGDTLAYLVTVPFFAAVSVVLYFDRRAFKEGFEPRVEVEAEDEAEPEPQELWASQRPAAQDYGGWLPPEPPRDPGEP